MENHARAEGNSYYLVVVQLRSLAAGKTVRMGMALLTFLGAIE